MNIDNDELVVPFEILLKGMVVTPDVWRHYMEKYLTPELAGYMLALHQVKPYIDAQRQALRDEVVKMLDYQTDRLEEDGEVYVNRRQAIEAISTIFEGKDTTLLEGVDNE